MGQGQEIVRVTPIIGLEVHIELCARTKVFSRCPSPAAAGADAQHEHNTLIDAFTLALPGSLPVLNERAVEMAVRVGLALNCRISESTRWDRKSYFYPDMPKAYQISQHELPLCADGVFHLPGVDESRAIDVGAAGRVIGIIRAHLEEDAGKLLHEAPGGGAIDFSIVDYNRAGTALLEVVTQPDFQSAAEVVRFAKALRTLCRALGVTEGDMQRGHMRFEPNVNCEVEFAGGRVVRTPITEVKNINSFRALEGAIAFELREQPARHLQDGRVMGPGEKTTRGWDDVQLVTYVQREKEDAQDYRYFPDPDLPALRVSREWVERVRAELPELPVAQYARFVSEDGLSAKEAALLTDGAQDASLYDSAVGALCAGGMARGKAARGAANVLLQSGLKRANERGVSLHELGVRAGHVAGIVRMREDGSLSAQSADQLVGAIVDAGLPGGHEDAGAHAAIAQREDDARAAAAMATKLGLLTVRDDAALAGWVEQAILVHPQAAADVRAGKVQAVGRIVGEVMKLAGGRADAKSARERVLKGLGVEG